MTKQPIIKVGFCVAYDWHLLKTSLHRVYSHANSICLSIDKNRKSWSGKPYPFDHQGFTEWLDTVDIDKKVSLYEDDFSLSELSAIQNDNRQRTMMSEFMGQGGWHIQVDSDEYFFDFEEFKNYLIKLNGNPTGKEKPINICCSWISIFKKTQKGYLVVDNGAGNWETMPFATNRPEYLNARRNSHFNHVSKSFVLHETWARSEEELKQKLDSWGHENDFGNKKEYLEFWKSLNESNFHKVIDFHPLKKGAWHALKYFEADTIDELSEKILTSDFCSIDVFQRSIMNSRQYQRAVQWSRKLYGKS